MKKKNNNWFLKLLGCLFVVYIALFIANISGYYENKVRDNVTLTDHQIKKFEEHLVNGEEIDLNSFLKNEKDDYSSKISKVGDNITSNLEKILADGITFITNILKSLF